MLGLDTFRWLSMNVCATHDKCSSRLHDRVPLAPCTAELWTADRLFYILFLFSLHSFGNGKLKEIDQRDFATEFNFSALNMKKKLVDCISSETYAFLWKESGRNPQVSTSVSCMCIFDCCLLGVAYCIRCFCVVVASSLDREQPSLWMRIRDCSVNLNTCCCFSHVCICMHRDETIQAFAQNYRANTFT